MRFDLDRLPTDIPLLHQIVRELAQTLRHKDDELSRKDMELQGREAELEKLRLILDTLRRQRFSRSSEKHDPDQLSLLLEEVEEQIAALEAAAAAEAGEPDEDDGTGTAAEKPAKGGRKPLPEHLEREQVRHEPEGCACPSCGGALHQIGEDRSEVLDYEPARFIVIENVRPRFACRACETITQMPAPSQPIEGGRPGPGLLAQVLVAKYADHLPLYRQSGIYARSGVDLDRSTLADWVGKVSWLLQPLDEALSRHVFGAAKVHTDDTPVPVLKPGNGKTRKGRLWVYARDDRSSGDMTPPAAVFRYSPNRKGEHPRAHLADYQGYLQADAYSGYKALYLSGSLIEVGCWAHARRKIFDVHAATGSPIADQALNKIAELYAIEKPIRGRPPDQRLAVRQREAVPRLDDLKLWFEAQLRRLAPKSALAEAFRYALAHWTALRRYADDGRLEIDNNIAENIIRGVALGRKNYLFFGSDAGGQRAALIYSLIETCKLNGIDPFVYLRDVIGRIADHPIKRVDELLPFNWAEETLPVAA